MNTLLGDEGVKRAFFDVMVEVHEFQSDVLHFLVDNPDRPVQVVVQQLCSNCGPMSEENKYVLNIKCKACGNEKSMEFY